jgi:hypothetical protein
MAYTGKVLREVASFLCKMPDGIYFDTPSTGETLCFIVHTQADCTKVRACFPGVIWSKKRDDGLGWWEYSGVWNGRPLRIYGVHEAPPTCHATIEEYEVEEKVPVEFETKTVTKTRTKWVCDDGAEVRDA